MERSEFEDSVCTTIGQLSAGYKLTFGSKRRSYVFLTIFTLCHLRSRPLLLQCLLTTVNLIYFSTPVVLVVVPALSSKMLTISASAQVSGIQSSIMCQSHTVSCSTVRVLHHQFLHLLSDLAKCLSFKFHLFVISVLFYPYLYGDLFISVTLSVRSFGKSLFLSAMLITLVFPSQFFFSTL